MYILSYVVLYLFIPILQLNQNVTNYLPLFLKLCSLSGFLADVV